MAAQDTIYRTPRSKIERFVFDEAVAHVFDDMIGRSVPLYDEVQEATVSLAKRLVAPGSAIYDLGCSTATTLRRLCEAIDDPTIRFVGVDSSQPMLDRAGRKLADVPGASRVELVCCDLRETDFQEAGIVVLNYTLQFFPPEERLALLRRIAQALRPGGALLLTEKVCHDSPQLQSALTELYYDFKRKNGYSELEISQKREALENVLVPLTAGENAALLKEAGFETVEPYLKWYTFVSFIAVR